MTPVRTSPLPPLARPLLAGGVHQHVPLRRGRHRPVPLQHQHAAVGHGKVPAPPSPGRRACRSPPMPGKLHVMGRQDCDAPPAGVQYIHMPGKGVYAVGVQHHRLLRLQQFPAPAAPSASLRPSPGPSASTSQPESFSRICGMAFAGEHSALLRQGEGHGRDALGCLHRPDDLRHPQRHQSAAGAHRRRRRQIRRAGVPHGAAHNQQLPEGALVAVRPAGAAAPSPTKSRSTVWTELVSFRFRSAGIPMSRTRHLSRCKRRPLPLPARFWER